MASLKRVFASTVMAAVVTIATLLFTLGSPAASFSPIVFRTGENSNGIGIRLIDVSPANEDDPRSRQHITDTIKPGTTITRHVEVSNATKSPHRVALYSAAAHINNGSFVGDPGRASNELSSWTMIENPTLGLPAESVTTTTVTIAVPADAPSGEVYGVVWAELSTPTRDNSALVKRVGIRMYVEVSATEPRPAGFAVDTVLAQREPNGTPVILAQVHNTGGRALDFSGTVKLSNIVGTLSAGPYQAEVDTTLAPGQSEPVKFLAGDNTLANGPWNVALELVSGRMREQYQAHITFPERASAAQPFPVSYVSPMIGWVVGGLLAFVFLAALTLPVLLFRRRRH